MGSEGSKDMDLHETCSPGDQNGFDITTGLRSSRANQWDEEFHYLLGVQKRYHDGAKIEPSMLSFLGVWRN